jgi:hypothetical protein
MTSTTLADDLDTHLSTYLSLLHSYTALRVQLSTATSSLNQHLARANFSSDRGWRYGQDDYDERMQASVIIQSTVSESSAPRFEIVKKKEEEGESKETNTEPEEKDSENGDSHGGESAEHKEKQEGKEELKEKEEKKPSRPKNPALHQFGILVPPALRQAQSTAEEMVRNLIPKLASVDAEMKALEIEVRRCRKKAKKLEEKEAQERIQKVITA